MTKFDPMGNIVYSTYFGGRGSDSATAMAVDAAGNVFVTGTTYSPDFPVSQGAYASSGNVFVFKLNPDGSLGYSTYFSGTIPEAIATDGSGSAWLAGSTDGLPQGAFPVTPGALSTTCSCGIFATGIGPGTVMAETTLTRFDAAGSSLIFSTYVPGSSVESDFELDDAANALALAPDGTAYVGGGRNFPYRPDRHLAAFVDTGAEPERCADRAYRPRPRGDGGGARWKSLRRRYAQGRVSNYGGGGCDLRRSGRG